MKQYLPLFQIVISLLLAVSILFQQGSKGMGSAFGGGGSFYATRRGFQKKLFILTIILAALFVILAVLNLVF